MIFYRQNQYVADSQRTLENLCYFSPNSASQTDMYSRTARIARCSTLSSTTCKPCLPFEIVRCFNYISASQWTDLKHLGSPRFKAISCRVSFLLPYFPIIEIYVSQNSLMPSTIPTVRLGAASSMIFSADLQLMSWAPPLVSWWKSWRLNSPTVVIISISRR